MRFGGIILCGGRSSRMGAPKPWLPFGDDVLLIRVVRQLRTAVWPIVVVAAKGQELPPLDETVTLACDRLPDRGPLEGIAVGLAALKDKADAAFFCGCDAALLSPEFVRRLCDLLGDADAVVPIVAGYRQTLSSVCRVSVLPEVEALLAANDRQTHRLFDRIHTRFITEAELGSVDPDLQSIRTMNTPAEYLAALGIAGLPPPSEDMLRSLFAPR